MAEVVEKSFERFLDLSAKIRTVIFDEMQPAERCRITRCSKTCNNEAKASRNYIHQFFMHFTSSYIEIRIDFNKYERFGEAQGFIMRFEEQLGEKQIRYFGPSLRNKFWEVQLERSVDLVQLAVEEFKKRIQMYQNSMKVLDITKFPHLGLPSLENTDFGLESLDNLEELIIIASLDIHQILTKIRKPLKTLVLRHFGNNQHLEKYKQIYKVEKFLNLWGEKLNNRQFLKIAAKRIHIRIGKLTERNVFHFIRSWQNGTIQREIVFVQWDLRNSDFDVRKVYRLLRIDYVLDRNAEIKHFIRAGESATLCVRGGALRFNVSLKNFWIL